MPRPVQSTGRADTPVIPEDWETAHAVVAARAQRGFIALRRPGFVQHWDQDTEQMVTTPRPPYAVDVTARIQQLTGTRRQTVVSADDSETVVDHLIQIPWVLEEPLPGDVVTVTEGDPAGGVLVVMATGSGTERFTRDLWCTRTT
jgi:hypothetical protein